jgi:aryl-alcohol dehydrogenase-like predicted oxidoreductase
MSARAASPDGAPTMELRPLGGSDLRVSALGLGCNNFGHIPEQDAQDIIREALDHGVTLFDTADVYASGRSEECLGRWLGPRRKDVIIATKFGHPSAAGSHRPCSAANVVASLEASLKRLRTDWIDLYQVHFPDGTTPIEATLRALDDLVRQGKVRQIGCCNFAGWQLADALWTACHHGYTSFASCQNEYNLLARGVAAEVIPAARHFRVGLLPFFPLASGLLTGKYDHDTIVADSVRTRVVRGFRERFLARNDWHVIEQLREYCRLNGRAMAEVAIAWLLAQPVVSSVIAGATHASQVRQNLRALSWQMTGQELAALDRIINCSS